MSRGYPRSCTCLATSLKAFLLLWSFLQKQSLSVFHNQLDGSLPTEFFLMTQLRKLDLGSNGFTGVLPTKLEMPGLTVRNLSSLLSPLSGWLHWHSLYLPQSLVLSKSTNLNGVIPAEFAALTKLKTLALDEIGLSGTIPSELAMPQLEVNPTLKRAW